MNRPGNEPGEYPEWIVPHADHGDPDCCGLIFPVIEEDVAKLTCNECGVVIAEVPAADARVRMADLASGSFAIHQCPACRRMNVIQGFDQVLAFTCTFCGEGVRVEPR